jgi:hypothetical protein
VIPACLLFALLLGAYLGNGDILPGNDSKSNTFVPVSLLTEGNLSFTPAEAPFMFAWVLQTDDKLVQVDFNSGDWDKVVEGDTLRSHYQAGKLRPAEPGYYIAPSIRGGRADMSVCVSTFGPGAGLCAMPVFAVLHAASGDLAAHPQEMWHGAKVTASMLVAGSAVFIFFTCTAFVGRWKAFAIALAYGLGTCVWSTSSQALWQHGPNEFFLALGTLLLVRIDKGWPAAAGCGLAYACAVACRPTSVIVAAAVGLYLLTANRKAVVPYVLGALPVAVLLGAYNWHYFESPFIFGQSIVGRGLARQKTGSDSLLQTPIWEGAAGLLLSPSRGLLVYSPFAIFSLWGLTRVWRRETYSCFRPLTVAMAILLVIAFCWFDWWGGWCYGYRPLVDTMPFFAILLIPVIDSIWRRKWLAGIAAVLLAWSVFVQVLGAWAYDLSGWNAGYTACLNVPGRVEPVAVSDRAKVRELVGSGAEVQSIERHDVDLPQYRDRLWSISDWQIGYYIRNFAESRAVKQEAIRQWISKPES